MSDKCAFCENTAEIDLVYTCRDHEFVYNKLLWIFRELRTGVLQTKCDCKFYSGGYHGYRYCSFCGRKEHV